MTEIELKIELTAQALETLLQTELFQQSSTTASQHDTYFDTPGQSLRRDGFSLRVRASGNGFKQTIKSVPLRNADIYARGEWERPLPDARPILDFTTPLTPLQHEGEILVPQFEVRAERQRWLVLQDGSQIEIALDRGTVIAGDRQTVLCEMELELKDGKADSLFALLKRLAAITPFKVGVVSKSERGYRLLDALPEGVKAEPVVLDRTVTVPASLQQIAAACFRQFRLNEAILIQRRAPEALHGARVALRRLRSALRIYRKQIGDGDGLALDGELRWLAALLGRARDIDVLLARFAGTSLQDDLREARERAYDAVLEALGSERASLLFVDFNAWLRCGAYLTPADAADEPPPTLMEFAADTLAALRRKLRKHGKSLKKLEDDGRHRARKDAKRLRYASEFFGSLFTDRKSARKYQKFVAAIERLQDSMGAVNDLVATDLVLQDLGLSAEGSERGKAPADAEKAKRIDEAQTALDRLLAQKKFWR